MFLYLEIKTHNVIDKKNFEIIYNDFFSSLRYLLLTTILVFRKQLKINTMT